MSRARLTLLIQIAISVGLLVLLSVRVPLRDSVETLLRVHPLTVVSAILLSLIGYLGRARRWSALLERGGIQLTALSSYVLTLVGTGYGLLTPGRVGEFARALHLRNSRKDSVPSMLWDRIADILLLELMSLPAFLLIPAWRGHLLLIYLAITAVSIGLVLLLDRPHVLDHLARRWPKLAEPTRAWRTQSSGMLSSRAFRTGILGGLFFYCFSYLAAFLLLRDLAPTAPPLLFLALPVIPFLGNLPVAFGGLGLREHVSAIVFAQLGATASAGPAFSLLWFATATLVPGLIGLALSPTPWARGQVVESSSESPSA